MIRLAKSFYYAMSGIIFCVKYERNMRIHIAVTLYVLYFSKFYEFTRTEWIMLILTCILVLVLEMLNTSIEVVIDKVMPGYHTLAKIGKDIAAGAVLVATITAVIVGILLFWDVQVFTEIFAHFTGKISNILLFSATLAVSYIFINSVKRRRRSNTIKEEEKNK